MCYLDEKLKHGLVPDYGINFFGLDRDIGWAYSNRLFFDVCRYIRRNNGNCCFNFLGRDTTNDIKLKVDINRLLIENEQFQVFIGSEPSERGTFEADIYVTLQNDIHTDHVGSLLVYRENNKFNSSINRDYLQRDLNGVLNLVTMLYNEDFQQRLNVWRKQGELLYKSTYKPVMQYWREKGLRPLGDLYIDDEAYLTPKSANIKVWIPLTTPRAEVYKKIDRMADIVDRTKNLKYVELPKKWQKLLKEY